MMENDIVVSRHVRYYHKNKESINVKRRARYQLKREEILASHNNPEFKAHKAEYDSSYQKTHVDTVHARNNRHYHKYRTEPLHRIANVYSSYVYYHKIKNAIFEILGNQCIICGFNDRRALQIDHINGGGTEEIRAAGNSRNMWRDYLKLPPEEIRGKLQVLCANCNWIKIDKNRELKKMQMLS